MTNLRRRDLLTGTALALVGGSVARGSVLSGSAADPLPPGQWLFFTPSEAAMVEALVDRLIPPDPQTPGGKDAGCAVFIDRQLAGPYGRAEGLYDRPPFVKGSKQQGPQSALTPSQVYRAALRALEHYCRSQPDGKSWVELGGEQQDAVLHGLDGGAIELEGADAKVFFEGLLKDVQEGFFADPLYGGNRDMCAWKMIGFPGAHYDYRDWVTRHNERYPHPPVSIAGRPDWNPKQS